MKLFSKIQDEFEFGLKLFWGESTWCLGPENSKYLFHSIAFKMVAILIIIEKMMLSLKKVIITS